MSSSWWTKFIAVVVATTLAGIVLAVSFADVDRDAPDTWPGWFSTLNGLVSAQITPGLDLQGGLHLQYQVDVEAALDDRIERFADEMRGILQEGGIDGTVQLDMGERRITMNVPGGNALDTVGADTIRDMNLKVLRSSGEELVVSFDDEVVGALKSDAVEQTISTISRRIDDMGLAEPSIQPRGDTDIIIQLPGLSEARFDEVKSIIETTAQLEFRLMSDRDQDPSFWAGISVPPAQSGSVVISGGYLQSSSLTDLQAVLQGTSAPTGTEFGFEELTTYNIESHKQVVNNYRARLMQSKVWLTGDTVASAEPARDGQTNKPVVSMTFDGKGARAMGDMTRNNLGSLMTIVLDEVIVSVATIQGTITSRGQISLGRGNDAVMMSQASHISLALRNGALVAPIEKQFETHVGPTLGAESVRKGRLSLMVAFSLVVLFVLVYYKASGIIANLALLLNVAFIFAILGAFKATLTLPGLAGITLTIGMAVDANVIIFERIKEELALGRGPSAAIHAGYEKAFSAILDANVTSGIAALVLYQYGTGPVRGFALTLIIGIICSVFTALVVTRLVFDVLVEKGRIKRLII